MIYCKGIITRLMPKVNHFGIVFWKAFAGVIAGLLTVIKGTVFLWWNEGNNVRNIKTTDEVEKNIPKITAMSNCAQYSGQLVAVGGKFTVEDASVSDEVFQVSVHSAALDRVVEIYQWEEEPQHLSVGRLCRHWRSRFPA